MPALSPEAVYMELGRLAETMPNLRATPLPTETYRWLGRLDAILAEVDESSRDTIRRLSSDLAAVTETKTGPSAASRP
jgi:hypothetical protein